MKELLYDINSTLYVLNIYIDENHFSSNEWPYREMLRVLTLLKEKIIKENELEIRLLRAMKDIYVVAFRNFEGTPLYDEINNVDNKLRILIKGYEQLEPLGMDFGKGDPI